MKIPGLVDLQVNGYKGVHFSSRDLTRDDFVWACRELLEAGTTAFLPTMITSPKDVYQHNLPIIAAVVQQEQFRGQLLGVHLEGPFISEQEGARGIHSPKWIREPDISYLQQLIEWTAGEVRLITIAAETKGAEQLARYAVSRGIAVSLGHQMANEQDLEKLVRAGAVSLTHLGNGVPRLVPRHKNPVWAGLDNDNLFAMIITDGHHLPASLLKTIIRTKGADHCVVVSDGTSLSGPPPGSYEMLGNKVFIEDSGRLCDAATGYLAGSSATLFECMNHLSRLSLVNYDDLTMMGFYNPLKIIGVAAEHVAQVCNIWFDENEKVFHLKE